MKKKIKIMLFFTCSWMLFPANTLLFRSIGYLLFLILTILFLLDWFDDWDDFTNNWSWY